MRPRIRLATSLGVMLSLVMASVTYGWSATNAIAYADVWWTNYNPVYVQYTSDCANFVSQAIFAGGYPMNSSTNNPWYANYGYANLYSQSWRLVQYNFGFFVGDGGSVVKTYYGIKTASPAGVSSGDIVYYDWVNDHTYATEGHEALVTSTSGSATTTGETGVIVVNAHTSDRYHEYWTLYKWNTRWANTYYQIVHQRRP